MAILGIDFGLSKVGLAVADSGLVQPLAVINNASGLVDKITALCQEHQIKRIVVGLPEGKIALAARDFGQRLAKKIDLPIDFQDETLTTQDAIVKMISAGKSKKARRTEQDAFAAAVILQEYLERHNV